MRRRAAAVALVGVALVSGVLVACSRLSGAPDLGPGVTARWLELSRFSDRRALVVAPSSITPGKKGQPRVPLVVVIHGLGYDPEQMARTTGWVDAARDKGLVVAFADGLDHSFNAGTCCGQSASDGVDDVGYLQRVIEDTEDRFPIDTGRVFMMGHSNGGMMTYRFLCSHAGELAGAASVAGTDAADCTPDHPVPFLQISGDDDPIVPLKGGRSAAPGIGPFRSVTGSVADVAASMSCPAPVVVRARPVTSTRWAPCADGATVGLDVVGGASHGYPANDSYAATPRILQFWGLG